MQPNAGTLGAEVGEVGCQTLFEHLLDGVVDARLSYEQGLTLGICVFGSQLGLFACFGLEPGSRPSRVGCYPGFAGV